MSPSPSPTRRAALPATVVALGWVSFFTDFSSEMMVPLLPVFLTSIGGTKLELGLLQGLSDAIVSVLKLISGRLSDRLAMRKPWVVAGYALSASMRPVMALVTTPLQALLARSGDRIGKGIRSAPRDALIAEVAARGEHGRAFGLQRAMDHAGALIGALAAFALLRWTGITVREVFLWAAVPGGIGVLVLILGVREPRRQAATAAAAAAGDWRPLLPFLIVVALAACGSSIDLLLLAWAFDCGVPAAQAPLLWALLHLVRSSLATRFGAWSDRLGRRGVIAVGLSVQAVVLVLFGLASSAAAFWPLFALHGLHAALTEGAERGLVADLTGAGRRGAAFGLYYTTSGVAALFAAPGIGWIYDAGSAPAAMFTAAGCSLLAVLVLLTAVRGGRR